MATRQGRQIDLFSNVCQRKYKEANDIVSLKFFKLKTILKNIFFLLTLSSHIIQQERNSQEEMCDMMFSMYVHNA